MVQQTSDYWQKRQEQTFLSGEKTVNDYYQSLKKSFEQANKEIQQVIYLFYAKYADNNGVSFTKAQTLLDKQEIGELKDFIERVNETMGEYDQELTNMSIKARITRYEALKKQIDATLQKLYAVDYEHNGKSMLKELYTNTYYQNWYSTDVYTGFHFQFAQVEPISVETLINYPFNGANYSDRLWKQKDFLQQQLNESITTMLVQGKNPATLKGEFAKKFQSREYDAYRLLHTDGSFIIEQGTLAAYKESGVEKYQNLATLDMKTSDMCREIDGSIYLVAEAVTGINYPPFHAFCRTTTTPRYEDVDYSKSTRVARDEEGKVYKVPADMTYKEWHDKYIGSNPEMLSAEKKTKNYTSDKKLHSKYKSILGSDVPKSLDEFQNLKYNNTAQWEVLKDNFAKTNRFNKLVEKSANLKIKGQVIKELNRIDLSDFEFSDLHINTDRKHNVTKKMAQSYIDNAIAAYSRWNGKVRVYVSENGCSVINLEDKKVSTAYKSIEYDEKFKKLLEVMSNDKMSNN
ncbi:minor capsid protein [Aminipila terrae]|uniref:Phage head morphogenesis protein n=1 Tax=Aminipila terrae TaxID=2697030 RepID=A0A6P1MFS1_9FIRM|nr:minor capsid protein [Aminipila terrae]QHI72892.1 phage head morphogenesis protein [Aminipila terrae]